MSLNAKGIPISKGRGDVCYWWALCWRLCEFVVEHDLVNLPIKVNITRLDLKAKVRHSCHRLIACWFDTNGRYYFWMCWSRVSPIRIWILYVYYHLIVMVFLRVEANSNLKPWLDNKVYARIEFRRVGISFTVEARGSIKLDSKVNYVWYLRGW